MAEMAAGESPEMGDSSMPENLMPAELAEIIATHRAMFGGFVMESEEPDGAQGPTDDTANPPSAGEQQLPPDHPLVKSLAAQKAEIKELKARASKLDEIERAQMTEAEKSAEKLRDAEERATREAARAARLEVAVRHRLAPDDVALLEKVTDAEALEALAARLAADKPTTPGKFVVPGQGTGTADPARPSTVAQAREAYRQRSTKKSI